MDTALPVAPALDPKEISDIGPSLKILAKLKKVSQHKIAEQCGISRITVNRFFRGHTEVRAGDLEAILRIFNIDIGRMINIRMEEALDGTVRE